MIYEVVDHEGNLIAGGFTDLSAALLVASLMVKADCINRVFREPAIVKDGETGLWCSPDEWPLGGEHD